MYSGIKFMIMTNLDYLNNSTIRTSYTLKVCKFVMHSYVNTYLSYFLCST